MTRYQPEFYNSRPESVSLCETLNQCQRPAVTYPKPQPPYPILSLSQFPFSSPSPITSIAIPFILSRSLSPYTCPCPCQSLLDAHPHPHTYPYSPIQLSRSLVSLPLSLSQLSPLLSPFPSLCPCPMPYHPSHALRI